MIYTPQYYGWRVKHMVYITGNQPGLGDWHLKKVKMYHISELEREIILTVQSPAQFKFTKGSWDTELPVAGTNHNLMIKPESKAVFEFEVKSEE